VSETSTSGSGAAAAAARAIANLDEITALITDLNAGPAAVGGSAAVAPGSTVHHVIRLMPTADPSSAAAIQANLLAPIPPVPPVPPLMPTNCGCETHTPPPPVVTPPSTPPTSKPGVKPTVGTIAVVSGGESVLALTGVVGMGALLPGAALLLVLGMILLVLSRRRMDEPEFDVE
jgi:hypothetical protein